MGDRFHGVSVFLAVVEAQGFAAAAARLNLSRSAVGKTIANLELRLGVRLFHRTTRSLSLTPEGQIFYEHCLRASGEIALGEAILETGQQEAVGLLRVTMPVLFGRLCVAPILLELARNHPKLELDLSFTDRPVDLVADGFDLAVRSGAVTSGDGLSIRRLTAQQMVVCAAPSYLRARGEPRQLGDIAAHDIVAYGHGPWTRTWLFPQPDGKQIEIRPSRRFRFDDLEVVASATAAGMGLAWLPLWLVRRPIEAGALVQVLKSVPAMAFDIHALWPQARHLPHRVRVAIDTLAERLVVES